MSHHYPDSQTRILRARERGIRAYASDANPYRFRASGRQLHVAWSLGRTETEFANGDMSCYGPESFELIDLSAEFISLLSELDATLPDAWPQEGAA